MADGQSGGSLTGATTEHGEPAGAPDGEDHLEAWAKHANGEGADPFPEDVVGFALGMDESQVRKICATARGEMLDVRPLRCRLDAVLRQVLESTALWLDAPKRGWKDGGVSVDLDEEGHVCGISVGLSGSDVGPVVTPTNLIASLGVPTKVVDARQIRVARWHWPDGERGAFVGWSHHLPSYRASGGQRQWVSYCKMANAGCAAFCSYLK